MKEIITIILLMTTLIATSQQVSITKSEIFKDSKRDTSLEYSLDDGTGGLVTIRSFMGGYIPKLKGYYIQHFDSSLKLIKEIEYEVDKNHIKNAFIKDNQLHLIEYYFDKKASQVSFNVKSSDLEKLSFTKKEILSLSEENQKKYFGIMVFPFFISNFSQIDGNHAGEVIISDNNEYFLINFDINNKEKETHKIFVFNTNFEMVYEQTIQKDVEDKYFSYQNIDIDDKDGTVYFLGKYFENKSKKSKKKGKVNYHYELFKIDANGQTNSSFKYDDVFVSSLELIKAEDRLVCVGFYGKLAGHKINGVCLFDLDENSLKIKKEKFNPFSKEFLVDKYGNKEGKIEKKKEKGIKNIDFKGLYIMDNGDISVNAEEFYSKTHTSTNGSYTTYHFDDIMSLRMNSEGDLKWARNINKRQVGFLNSSYTSIPVGEDSYFFINCSDNIKKLSGDRISFKHTKAKKSNLYMIKINKDGNFDFKKLIDDKESKVYYKVNNGNVNLNNQTVILTGKRKKNTRILKLKM